MVSAATAFFLPAPALKALSRMPPCAALLRRIRTRPGSFTRRLPAVVAILALVPALRRHCPTHGHQAGQAAPAPQRMPAGAARADRGHAGGAPIACKAGGHPRCGHCLSAGFLLRCLWNREAASRCAGSGIFSVLNALCFKSYGLPFRGKSTFFRSLRGRAGAVHRPAPFHLLSP